MATLTQLRNRVDAFVSSHWPTLVARQENYRTNRGTYWQGLRTHTIIPTHTSGSDGDTIADRLSIKRADVYSDWKTVFPEWDGVVIPCAIEVNNYGNETSQGWEMKIWVIYNSKTYCRVVNVGPEATRALPWTEIVE